MKTYRANRKKTGNLVFVGATTLSPKRSQAVFNHSPDGFSWGFGGSEPSQLALAILLDLGVEDDMAVRFHQDFKWEFVANAPEDGFTIKEEEVRRWLEPRIKDASGAPRT